MVIDKFKDKYENNLFLCLKVLMKEKKIEVIEIKKCLLKLVRKDTIVIKNNMTVDKKIESLVFQYVKIKYREVVFSSSELNEEIECRYITNLLMRDLGIVHFIKISFVYKLKLILNINSVSPNRITAIYRKIMEEDFDNIEFKAIEKIAENKDGVKIEIRLKEEYKNSLLFLRLREIKLTNGSKVSKDKKILIHGKLERIMYI